ncbi:MAG: acyl-CoA/acyl-ACP dehydrogenase [Rubrobacter sp.]|nr:acyl-CoA/acyl-ACP dehydrogenase [Rubrobacter sp.]
MKARIPDAANKTLPGGRLDAALAGISAGAAGRDEHPAFPGEAFEGLAAAGALALPVPVDGGGRRSSFREEWELLRAVARADGSVGRIYDGHLNAVERLAVAAPEPLRSRELSAVARGELLLGVWGADPVGGEGPPARLVEAGGGLAVEGVKTFCSGSTGLQRALVAVRGLEEASGLPLLAYVDLEEVEVDRSWFRGSGLRASESHRVVFHGSPVLAMLGGPGELVREPYFSRDAIRTSASWAGIADRAVEAALGTLSGKARAAGGEPDDLVSLAAGRMLAAQGTIDRWLEEAARRADRDPEASLAPVSTSLRSAVADACREILDEAARACGSRPFATGDPLDRARRDLDLFLLQHRLEPALVRSGRQAILENDG